MIGITLHICGRIESHESVLHPGEIELAYYLPIFQMFVVLKQACFSIFALISLCGIRV